MSHGLRQRTSFAMGILLDQRHVTQAGEGLVGILCQNLDLADISVQGGFRERKLPPVHDAGKCSNFTELHHLTRAPKKKHKETLTLFNRTCLRQRANSKYLF